MSRKEEIIPRIQKAALDEFIKKGVEASSMEGIAKLAGTTKRTLYKYYPSKEIVFDQIIGLLLDKFDAHSNFKYSSEIPVEQQLDGIIKNKIDLMTNNDYVKISKLLSIELIKSNPINDSHYKRFYKSEHKFVKWVQDAQKDRKVKRSQSAQLIANQLLSIIKGQVFYPVLFGMSSITKKEIAICHKTAKTFFINIYISQA